MRYAYTMARHRQETIEQTPLFSKSKMDDLIHALASVGANGVKSVDIALLPNPIDPNRVIIPKVIVDFAEAWHLELEQTINLILWIHSYAIDGKEQSIIIKLLEHESFSKEEKSKFLKALGEMQNGKRYCKLCK